MPRTYALLYDKHNRCWFQYYTDTKTNKRRKKHCGSASGKTYRPDYLKALSVWNEFKAELDDPRQHRRTQRRKPLPLVPQEHLSKDTVVGLIDIYLTRHTARRVRDNLLSIRTAKNRALALKYFTEFLGPKSRKTKEQGWGVDRVLNNERFAGLHDWMNRQINKEQRWKFSSGQMYFNVIKQFIRYCADKDFIIEAPSNLSSSTYHMKQANVIQRPDEDDKEVLLNSDEINDIFIACNEYQNGHPNHLYILLGLNTGMSPVDIGTLQRHNITFDEDGCAIRITKQRTKTGIEGTWILWNITSKYLTQHINELPVPTHKTKVIPQNEHFIFRRYITNSHKITRHPIMLSQRILNTAGVQYHHTNSLVAIINVLFKKAGLNKSSYALRKTFASHIANLTEYNTVYIAKFMAHKQSTMAMQAYVKTIDTDKFDEIIHSLLYSLGIDKHVHHIHSKMKERKRRYKDAKRQERREAKSRKWKG